MAECAVRSARVIGDALGLNCPSRVFDYFERIRFKTFITRDRCLSQNPMSARALWIPTFAGMTSPKRVPFMPVPDFVMPAIWPGQFNT